MLKYLHEWYIDLYIDPFGKEIFITNKRILHDEENFSTIADNSAVKVDEALKGSREALNRERCQSCYQKFVKLRAKSLLAITLCCQRFELRILKIRSRSSTWVVVHLKHYWKSWIVSLVQTRWSMYVITFILCRLRVEFWSSPNVFNHHSL